MSDKFNNLPRVLQFLLLLIPAIQWIVEIIVRWSVFRYEKDFAHLLFALLVTIFGVIPIFGWIDMIWCLLFHHMFLAVS